MSILKDLENAVQKEFDLTIAELDQTFPLNGLDSLDLLEMTLLIENELDIDLEDRDLEKCTSVRDILNLAERIKNGEAI